MLMCYKTDGWHWVHSEKNNKLVRAPLSTRHPHKNYHYETISIEFYKLLQEVCINMYHQKRNGLYVN